MAETRPALDQVNIVAANMDATVAFYRRLGVEIPDRSPEWDPMSTSDPARRTPPASPTDWK